MRNFKIDFVFILTAVTLSSVAAYAQLNCKDGAVIRGKKDKELYCAKITANGGEIRHGEYLSWHANGKPHEVANYKDDNPDGKYESFHSNGKPYAVANYKDGKRDGKLEWFYENGKPYAVANYKDGKLDGKYERFYDNGSRIFIKKYRMDDLLEEVVYEYTDDTCTTLFSITKKDGNGNVVCIYNPTLNSNFSSDTCGPLNEIQVEKQGKIEDTSLKAIPNGTPSNLSHQTPSDLSRQTPKTPVATPSAPVQ